MLESGCDDVQILDDEIPVIELSTARMAALDVLLDPFLNLLQCQRFGRVREQRPMQVLRGVTAGSADDDFVALLFPLENRARAQAQPATNLDGYGNLALGGQLGLCECHELMVPW
jgi:hypothetical protein